MTIIFINRFFYPDHSATSQILSDLAFALAADGTKVAIVTSRQHYDAPLEKELAPREDIRGVLVHRVWTSRFGRANLIGRAFDYLTFYFSAAYVLMRLARKDDIVVAKTDPPMFSVVAAPIARWRGARLVNWLQDIFPEVAEAIGVGSGRVSRAAYGTMRWLRNRSVQRADLNIALGDRMAEMLAGLGVRPSRIRIIPNWTDTTTVRPVVPADNPLRKDWGLSDAFVAGYSGNLGRAHEYATLLDAIAGLEAAGAVPDVPAARPIRWLFIGGGALFDAFKAEVERRGLATVHFAPYQPRARLAESLSVADVHLVSLRPELEGLIVPSKFYGVAAAGRATIFIGDADGEIARMLSKYDCGLTVSVGDGAALAQAVTQLAQAPERAATMGQNARRLVEERFDIAHALAAWHTIIAELSQPDGRPR